MTTNTQTSVDANDGSGLFMAILVVAGLVAIGSALFIDVITDVPKELPLALVGPLFGGLTFALLLTQYNRRQRSSLVTAVGDLEGRIAEQNAIIETHREQLRELESEVSELQGRNWGHHGATTRSRQSTASQTGQQARSGEQARSPTGKSTRTGASDGSASSSETRTDRHGDEQSTQRSAHHEDLVHRVEVSTDEPTE
ncbi:hypothetical protein [Halorientalis marina]|uniref:hypothetical protein n=1 Tax=Halorientalis marina TaxID=2931976 RepID=UPI001FF40366|nr:hypothetical protein [Halorientalis marina]